MTIFLQNLPAVQNTMLKDTFRIMHTSLATPTVQARFLLKHWDSLARCWSWCCQQGHNYWPCRPRNAGARGTMVPKLWHYFFFT